MTNLQDESINKSRRVNYELRSKIYRMSEEERCDAIYLHPVSGIMNRRAFNDTINPSDSIFCIIDLNYFKSINDNLSYERGDIILKLFAESLIGFLGYEIVYHYGGDEFVTVFNGESFNSIANSFVAISSFINLHHFKGRLPGSIFSFGMGKSMSEANNRLFVSKLNKVNWISEDALSIISEM